MKKLTLAAVVMAGLLSHGANAVESSAENNPVLNKFHALQNVLSSDAKVIGISKERYATAIVKYERFMSKLVAPDGYIDHDVPADILPFSQIPEVIEAKYKTAAFSAEFKQRLTSAINTNDAKLASYLQLSVDELYPFMKRYSTSVMNGNTIAKNKFNNGDVSIMVDEYVEFTCRSECGGFGMTSLDYMYLQDLLRSHHNGGFFTDVKVVTRDNDGSLHGIATWRVRADGLIWKRRAERCDSEIACFKEP